MISVSSACYWFYCFVLETA